MRVSVCARVSVRVCVCACVRVQKRCTAAELWSTCQTERFEPKLCAVEDDEAVCLVGPGGRVLHISLEVS